MIPVKVQTRLMGNTFEFIALAPNEQTGNEQIAVGIEEVKRIEKIFTTFSDNSVLRRYRHLHKVFLICRMVRLIKTSGILIGQ